MRKLKVSYKVIKLIVKLYLVGIFFLKFLKVSEKVTVTVTTLICIRIISLHEIRFELLCHVLFVN